MSKIIKVLGILTVITLGVTVFNMVTPPMLASLFQEPDVKTSVVNSVKKSIVALYSTSLGMRSGFVLTPDGLVVTLNSTIGVKNTISGYFEGDQVSLKNLHVANDNLALLRMTKSGDLPTVEFADESKIKVGQKVFLVAATSTEKDQWVVLKGSITQVSSEIITTDITGGSELSSGPLFNVSGDFLGISYLDTNGRISAVPINKVRAFKSL